MRTGLTGASAALPEVVEAVAEDGATQGEDGVGAVDGPVHAAAFEATADDVLARALDDAGGDAHAHGAKLRVLHAEAVVVDVVGAPAGVVAGWGMAAQGGEDVVEAALDKFVAASLAPLVSEIGAGAEDGLGDLAQMFLGAPDIDNLMAPGACSSVQFRIHGAASVSRLATVLMAAL